MLDLAKSGDDNYGDYLGKNNGRDTVVQLAFSCAIGFAALIGFCVLRPKWPSLYAARKKHREDAEPLPDLPDSLFGWMPALYRVTEQQVLASAGLDAYVLLRFFRMAIKFLLVTLFFSVVVFKPVHDAFPDETPSKPKHKPGHGSDSLREQKYSRSGKSLYPEITNDYLWMYLIFAYILTALALYLISTETEGIIGVRQSYLGSQSTITDRTIRLSGIPASLRSEDKIKKFIEELEIGKVESVTLCREWFELDAAMDHRTAILRKLEESWTVHLRQKQRERGRLPPASTARVSSGGGLNGGDDEETGRLLGDEFDDDDDDAHLSTQARPKATVRYGFLKLQYRLVDAIDYYEEKLRVADEKVTELRKKPFEATPIAFVTLDSVAACQMAVQAVLDPSPKHLIASPSPAPTDVVWRNVYVSRSSRMLRGWTITIAISVLSIFWSLLLVPIAGSLNLDTIHKIFPGLATALKSHPILKSLVSTQLPTLLSTLLFVAVPYLYDWLANKQGMISQGDVELSVVSKNFFFVFFNYFIVFTILGTASNFYSFWEQFRDNLKDFTKIAYTLATSLQGLQPFYTNLIILQGLGLFPLRLLEFGSVFLYPIYRLGAKTPRDYAELNQPPEFNYGFYLPQLLLIFLICMVYSILRESWKVILAGTVYFMIGGFVYKYQLLYAMDNPRHSTGKSWVMICNRIIVGLVIFQLTTAGQLALKQAYARSLATLPLVLTTIWFFYYYSRNYVPLMKHISLRSIERRASTPAAGSTDMDPDGWGEQARARYEFESHGATRPDESRDRGLRFVNPSLVDQLEDVWLADESARDTARIPTRRSRLESAINASL